MLGMTFHALQIFRLSFDWLRILINQFSPRQPPLCFSLCFEPCLMGRCVPLFYIYFEEAEHLCQARPGPGWASLAHILLVPGLSLGLVVEK